MSLTTIEYSDPSPDFRIVTIAGMMDIEGTDEIATRFAALAAATARKVVVDLSGVTFLASIGIRALISNAKASQQRGGKMFLFVGENAQVTETLRTTGIETLIPMYSSMADAHAAATS